MSRQPPASAAGSVERTLPPPQTASPAAAAAGITGLAGWFRARRQHRGAVQGVGASSTAEPMDLILREWQVWRLLADISVDKTYGAFPTRALMLRAKPVRDTTGRTACQGLSHSDLVPDAPRPAEHQFRRLGKQLGKLRGTWSGRFQALRTRSAH